MRSPRGIKTRVQSRAGANNRTDDHGRQRFLSTEDLDRAIEEVVTAAKEESVDVVLVGGAALRLFGSPRLTTDVDFVASKAIASMPGSLLSFGGVATQTSEGVPVDLIVRDDRQRRLYEAVFDASTAMRTSKGVRFRVAFPEILVPIKLGAGRGKDLDDLAFLVTDMPALNLPKAMKLTEKFLGLYAADELERFVEEARWRQARDRKQKGGS